MVKNNIIKKTIRIISYCLLFVSFCYSCNNSERLEYFNRNDFKNKSILYSEEIEVKSSKILNPLRLTVIRDSILLIQNRNPTDYYIDIYNINKQKIIASIAKKGKGPDEFLRGDQVLYNHNSDYFWIRDKVLWRMTRYNIDSVLEIGENYKPNHFKGEGYAKGITEFDEDYFVFFNKLFIYDKQFSNKDIRILYKKEKMNYLELDNKIFSYNYYPANVTGGDIYLSKFRDSIFVSHYCDDRIDILNKDLNVIKSLKGPDDLEPKYSRMHSMPKMILHADNKRWQGYCEGFYTDDAIYLLYDGTNGEPKEIKETKKSEVFKISWSGELLHHYILDTYVYIITLDSENKYIYGCKLESRTGVPSLVRFEL